MYWKKVQIFHSGPEYLQNLLQSIRLAHKSIYIEVYIFDICEQTLNLLEELKLAKNRGCKVQLLVDGFGSYQAINRIQKICNDYNLLFRVYQPMPNKIAWFRKFFIIYTLKVLRLLRKLNRRNHRKLCIIDENHAYVGSMNLTAVHFYEQAWRDTCVLVAGAGVLDLVRSFKINWQRAEKRALRAFHFHAPLKKFYDPRNSYVRINTSLRARLYLYRDLILRIRNAQNRICVTTAYFLPRRSLLRALKKAARRGVRVEIIIPGQSDAPMVKWAALEIAHTLTKAGVKIYEYEPRVLHAKILMVDNWASIGSTNLNHRSILHDLELEVVLTDAQSLQNLFQQWEVDLKNSVLFDEKTFLNNNFLIRFISRLLFLFRYLM